VKRRAWTAVFLGGTAVVVAMEFWASFDRTGNTVPWTEYIVTYLPPWFTIPAVVAFDGWLLWHFTARYLRKRRTR
jgi:hypothetical protein